jgi:hypothetical protein
LLSPLRRRQRALWLFAFLLYGVGDTVTTASGLRTAGVVEAGPIATRVIASFGVPGLVVQKAVFFLVTVAIWSGLRSPGRVAVPLALAVSGALITGWNLLVIFG